VKVVSLTFNHKEGHLSGIPRTQFRDIMFQIPGPIDKVIIAGGISSLDDLQYIWGFPKAIPQLGSAIWKHKISIADLCN
jgi:phosphoribosylformimino-5-aminoimidazole carboxamide ribonucleotide (ProFAR) isomerase